MVGYRGHSKTPDSIEHLILSKNFKMPESGKKRTVSEGYAGLITLEKGGKKVRGFPAIQRAVLFGRVGDKRNESQS